MYFANTWHKFNFVITPQEFEAIFGRDDYEFVIHNTRVDIDYTHTEKQEIFAAYCLYFEKILRNAAEYDYKTLNTIVDTMRQGMIDQTSKLAFSEVVLGGKVSEEYKLVRSKEPFMELDPFYLLYRQSKQQLSTAYFESQNAFGLQLSYPKTISLADKNDNLRGNYSTTTYPMCAIYQDIVKNIKKTSHKAKLMKGELLLKPNFWISDQAKAQVGKHYFFQQHQMVFL